ncbi:MAG: hypothetical protein ACI9JL_001559 [Paracoccaceae bacterium]|jgi:hypothetical protein
MKQSLHRRRSGIATLALIGALLPAVASAQTGGPSNAQLLQLLQTQQKQLNDMRTALQKAQAKAEKASATAQDAKAPPSKSILPDYLNIGGLVEVEATEMEAFDQSNTSDVTLSTVEAFIEAKPTDYVFGRILFLYEDEGTSETIEVDEGFAVLGNTEKFPAFLKAGKWAMPFGDFDTEMSAAPLTLELGETKEKAVFVGLESHGFSISGYVFNGDTQQTTNSNHIDQFGFAAGFTRMISGAEISIGAGYINNIADSDNVTTGLGGSASGLANYVPAVDVHGALSIGGFTVRGAYMTATRAFQAGELAFAGGGAEPAAWHTEASYKTAILNKEVTFAVTVQGTEEALALGLAESRVGGAVTVSVLEHAAVTVEYLHDTDYGTSDGGTGNTGHTATVKLAVEF